MTEVPVNAVRRTRASRSSQNFIDDPDCLFVPHWSSNDAYKGLRSIDDQIQKALKKAKGKSAVRAQNGTFRGSSHGACFVRSSLRAIY